MNSRLVALLGLMACALFAGCASSGYELADDTSASMEKTTGAIGRARDQIRAVLVSLDSIPAAKGGNLRPAFDAYSAEVDRTEKAAEGARKTAQSMRAKADERFKEWVAETEKITDPELKQAAAARRAESKRSFAKVTDAMTAVRNAYDPFMLSLKELRTALGQDLTAAGVDAAGPVIQRIRRDGASLDAAIGDVQAALASIRNELTSPTTPATGAGGAP